MKRTLRLWLLLTPVALYSIGALSNIIAISANKGEMPVTVPQAFTAGKDPGSLLDDDHVVWSDEVRFRILCDWIRVPHSSVISPGDVLLYASDYAAVPCVAAWFALVLFARREYL